MKICVAGLGLIGGSMCMALKRAGYAVDGANRSKMPLEYALQHNIIDGAAEKFDGYDVVFVALPPQATVDFIAQTKFKNGAVVSDICGVKRFVEEEVYKTKRNFDYIGCHPMAGKEVSGIQNACADLFDRASMVITEGARDNREARKIIFELTKAMGFKRIVECPAEVHDIKIAYTSQLAHIVSNAYVKNPEIDCCLGFTGGSFQDMTRIAGVDASVWASLYLKNADNVSKQISGLIEELETIKTAVDGGDGDRLAGILSDGKTRYENSSKLKGSDKIRITELK